MVPSSSKGKKKKVLALPIEEDGETKVLLLEPGRRRRKVRRTRSSKATATEKAQAAPAAEAAGTAEPAPDEPGRAEDESRPTPGLFGKLKARLPTRGDGDEDGAAAAEAEGGATEDDGEEPTAKDSRFSLPFGKKDEADKAEADADEDEAEADAVEAADEDSSGKRFSLPFGRSKTAEETEDEAETADDDEGDLEADPDTGVTETETPDDAGPGKARGLLGKLPVIGSRLAGGADEDEEAGEAAPEGPEAPEPASAEEAAAPDEVADAPDEAEAIEADEEADAEAETLETEALEADAETTPEAETAAAASASAEAAEAAEVAQPAAQTAQPPEAERDRGRPRFDPATVERIHYNVDMAIYRAAAQAMTSGPSGPRVDPAAVDRVLESAEASPEEQEAATGGPAAGAGPGTAGRDLPATTRAVDDVPGLSGGGAERLRDHGVETVTDLVRTDVIGLAVETGLRIADLREWQRSAELLHLEDLEPAEADLLSSVGIHRLDVLADQDADDLAERVRQYVRFRERGADAELAPARAREIVEAARRAVGGD